MLRVAQVLRRYCPERWGGTETVVHHLSSELQKNCVLSPVFATDMLSKSGTEEINGVTVHRFPYTFPWLGLSSEAKRQLELKGGNPLSFALFKALYQEPDLNLIHVHVQHRLGGTARTVAKLRGIPYVASIHGGVATLPQQQIEKMKAPFEGHFEWGRGFGFLLGAHRTLKDASAIICVGRDEYKAMMETYPEKQVLYMPNGVQVSAFSEANPWLFWKKYRRHEKEKFILCVSRFDSQKNQKLLLRAFARMKRRFPNYRLCLIGGVSVEDYYKELLELTHELQMDHDVLMIPGLDPQDPLLASAYKASDLFVLPSRNEPFGIVILEAWAAELPVITSAVGGIPGFTSDGENVLWFDNEDEQGLYRAMSRLAMDESLGVKLKTEGRQAVEKYNWKGIAQRYLDLYQSLVEKNRSG